jgi:hypothetical protein
MDNNQSQVIPRILLQQMIPPGGILPRHLAASTTMKAGDMYAVGTNGIFYRIPPGTVGQTLKIQSNGLPGWS